MVSPRGIRKRFRGIAQLVEQRSPKPRAEGSNPSAPAIKVFTTLVVCDIIAQSSQLKKWPGSSVG